MYNLKKHSLLILIMMLIFILMPISFAVDADNATGDMAIDDTSDILSDDEDEAWITIDENEYTIDEDDSTLIKGDVYLEIIDGSYPFLLNVECKYVDGNGKRQLKVDVF